MNDDEIQDHLQRGEPLPGSLGEAYLKIFSALRREPGFVLPPSFVDRVMQRIKVAPAKSTDMFWFFAGLTGCLIAMTVAIWLTGFNLKLPIPGFIKEYPELIFYGLLLVIALQWLDRRLVRKPT